MKQKNDSLKCIIHYSNDMDDLYENIEETNSNEKQKKLSVFDDIIANYLAIKNFNKQKEKYLLEN